VTMNPFADAAKAAAANAPHAIGEPHPQRVLVVDGDAVCYYCAGNDDTLPGEARGAAVGFLEAAGRAAGAGAGVVLAMTGRASHKGYRYAVARAKPYQATRSGARRPKNWSGLRDWAEEHPFAVILNDAEADDYMDLRMVPGLHLDWKELVLRRIPPDFRTVVDGKTYGDAWFWQQMLQGDTADNIPGLPGLVTGETYAAGPKAGQRVVKPVGEKTAEKLLADVINNQQARTVVQNLYREYYESDWPAAIAEQACLLWMRRRQFFKWDECLDVVFELDQVRAREQARSALEQRIAEAQVQ